MRHGLPASSETLTLVESPSALVRTMHLKQRSSLLLPGLTHHPSQRGSAHTRALMLGRDLDELEPRVPVTLTQIDGPNVTTVPPHDEHIVLIKEGSKELALLLSDPGTIGRFHEVAMRSLMEMEEPLLVHRGRPTQLDLHQTIIDEDPDPT